MGEFISAGVADGLEIEAPDFDFRLATLRASHVVGKGTGKINRTRLHSRSLHHTTIIAGPGAIAYDPDHIGRIGPGLDPILFR